MRNRKMVSIPADTHDRLFAFLEKQEEETGLKVTATSFLTHAIMSAMERQLQFGTKKKGKSVGTNP